MGPEMRWYTLTMLAITRSITNFRNDVAVHTTLIACERVIGFLKLKSLADPNDAYSATGYYGVRDTITTQLTGAR